MKDKLKDVDVTMIGAYGNMSQCNIKGNVLIAGKESSVKDNYIEGDLVIHPDVDISKLGWNVFIGGIRREK